jgi:hypothetical protein
MQTDLLIAVDVGINGGIAWCFNGGTVCAEGMPRTELEICEFFRDLCHTAHAPVAYVEKVHGFMPNQPQVASRSFTFGRNTGVCTGSLIMCGCRIIEIAPRTWQSELGLKFEKGTPYGDRKQLLKEEALRRFPKLRSRITLKTADALLILDAARGREI